ncbi:MAG: hypothetical protein HZB91_05995 [Elusimicrobia bacterium]|nr:hypothetical protein [Elusimicrobiota bacterium]
MSPEVSRMVSMQQTPSFEPLFISRLGDRYRIWGIRARNERELLRAVASAALRFDLKKGAPQGPLGPGDDLDADGVIDERDVLAAAQVEAGKAKLRVGGAEYRLDQVVEAANRYGAKVPGKTVRMPERERYLMELLAGQGLVERAGDRWRSLGGASLIFFSNSSGREELEHELVHALFVWEPGFRARAAGLWKSLGDEERAFITKSLGGLYNTKDEELMLTEFAAHGAGGFPGPLFKVPAGLSDSLKKTSRRLREARDSFLRPASARPSGRP